MRILYFAICAITINYFIFHYHEAHKGLNQSFEAPEIEGNIEQLEEPIELEKPE